MGNKWGIIWFMKSPSSKSCRTVVVTIVVYRTVISAGGEFSPYSSGKFLLKFRSGCAMWKCAL